MNLETNTVPPVRDDYLRAFRAWCKLRPHRILAHPSDDSSVVHAIGMISLEIGRRSLR